MTKNTLPPRHGGYKPKSGKTVTASQSSSGRTVTKSAASGRFVTKKAPAESLPQPPKGEGGGSPSTPVTRKSA
jgi:hypothetical protein